jgi:hypothetical protein
MLITMRLVSAGLIGEAPPAGHSLGAAAQPFLLAVLRIGFLLQQALR